GAPMINFNRRDRTADSNEVTKPALATAAYGGGPSASANMPGSGNPSGGTVRQPYPPQRPASAREMPSSPAARDSSPSVSSPPPPAPVKAADPEPASAVTPTEGSKLFIGVNILLKGVEISNCDAIVIEGNVEATVKSKAMEISKPGTLK